MTNNLRELSYDQLVEHTSEVLEELRHRAYHEGFKQGRFEAQVVSMYPAKEPEKESPQQARDRIVEQAKRNVEELIFERPSVKVNGLQGCSNTTIDSYGIEFVVDKKKRTIVALLRGLVSNKVRSRGIAKCAPTDCFNVHIGKVIALRRALGLEVPSEYLNAPQPTIARAGDLIEVRMPSGITKRLRIVDKDASEVGEDECLLQSAAVTRGRVVEEGEE